MKRKILLLILTGLAALILFTPARAGGPVDVIVTNCSNDTDLRTKMNELEGGQGGMLTFNCGTATIALSSALPTITQNTVIDAANKITLSGTGAVRLFKVNGNRTLTLKNIVLTLGYGGSEDGGAIYNDGRLILEHTTIQSSYTPHNGGAIYTNGRVDLTDSTLADNIATNGGGIYAAGVNAELYITNSVLHDNHGGSSGRGGAIFTEGTWIVTDSEFAANEAGSGGAVAARHVVASQAGSVTNSTFHNNGTTGSYPNANGAALLVDDVLVSVESTTFNNNNGQSGGAIYVLPGGRIDLTNSTLTQNNSTNGGGLYNKGTATLSGVTISNNFGTHGGGIDNFATLGLYNATVSGNSSTYGGGLKNEGAGSAGLVNVTLASNGAAGGFGGGIFHESNVNTHLYLKNVILADSPTGGNCDFNKPPDSAIFTFSSDNTCSFGTGHDSLNLMLGPLADNGGPTKTHLPQIGSPAIDAGTYDAPDTDQRGIMRPQWVAYDVGAVEVLCAKPPKPILVKPGNGKKAKGPAVLLDWQDNWCTNTYQVLIKLGSSSGSKVQKKGGLTTSEFTTKPLTKGVTYAWQVKACHPPFGCSKSEWRTFKVK